MFEKTENKRKRGRVGTFLIFFQISVDLHRSVDRETENDSTFGHHFRFERQCSRIRQHAVSSHTARGEAAGNAISQNRRRTKRIFILLLNYIFTC